MIYYAIGLIIVLIKKKKNIIIKCFLKQHLIYSNVAILQYDLLKRDKTILILKLL